MMRRKVNPFLILFYSGFCLVFQKPDVFTLLSAITQPFGIIFYGYWLFIFSACISLLNTVLQDNGWKTKCFVSFGY